MELHSGGEMEPAAAVPTAPGAATATATATEPTTALAVTCSALLALALLLHVLARSSSRSSPATTKLRRALDVGSLVVLWYALSIGLTLFNKWFLRVFADGGFPFATTMTSANMAIKCALSRLLYACSSSSNGRNRLALGARAYWRLAVPIGVCTALDIALSNLSFLYITVTLYTVVKAGGNVWNLLFSICLGHQRPSAALFVVIALISSGIALASFGATQFVWRGFVLVLAASVIGTLRWVLTQSLLQEMADTAAASRVLAVVYFISPASALGLLPLAVATEGRQLLASKFVREPSLLAASAGFLVVSGAIAFLLVFVEILLVKKTSALSLGIAGSCKDVAQIVLAVFIFGDHLLPLNVLGLVIATSGMLLYTFLKHATPSSDPEGTPSAGKYARVSTAEQPEDEDEDVEESRRITSSEYTIQVINMDGRSAKKVSKAVGSSIREDALVRRESKEYHHDHQILSAGTHV